MHKAHPKSEARRLSAVTLIRYLLDAKRPEILPEHRRGLLTVLLWKITEADGKYNTRFWSQKALACRDKSKWRHDHVSVREKMIAALEKAARYKVEDILKKPVGCVVTKEEHDLLSKFDKEFDGWKRYEKARVEVVDKQKMLPIRKRRA